MKKPIIRMALAALILTASFSSCKKSEDKIQDAKEDVVDAKVDLVQAENEALKDYENYKTEISKKITDNELKIADLKVKAIESSKDKKQQLNERIADLESKNKELKVKLDSYANYSADTWDAFRKDVDERAAALEKEFDDVNPDKK